MKPSVVVLAYGRPELTRACIASVRGTCNLELVVVDNGTGDEYDADRTVVNRTNQGFAVGCNQGFAEATGSPVIFLNNDCEVPQGWHLPLLQTLSEHKRCGIVGTTLVYPDGRLQHTGVGISRRDNTLHAWNRDAPGLPGPVSAVTAACMAVRPECFQELAGFDEGFWNGYEDVDLCLNAKQHGWEVRYAPGPGIVHHESASGPERWTRVRENENRLNKKWGER